MTELLTGAVVGSLGTFLGIATALRNAKDTNDTKIERLHMKLEQLQFAVLLMLADPEVVDLDLPAHHRTRLTRMCQRDDKGAADAEA